MKLTKNKVIAGSIITVLGAAGLLTYRINQVGNSMRPELLADQEATIEMLEERKEMLNVAKDVAAPYKDTPWFFVMSYDDIKGKASQISSRDWNKINLDNIDNRIKGLENQNESLRESSGINAFFKIAEQYGFKVHNLYDTDMIDVLIDGGIEDPYIGPASLSKKGEAIRERTDFYSENIKNLKRVMDPKYWEGGTLLNLVDKHNGHYNKFQHTFGDDGEVLFGPADKFEPPVVIHNKGKEKQSFDQILAQIRTVKRQLYN